MTLESIDPDDPQFEHPQGEHHQEEGREENEDEGEGSEAASTRVCHSAQNSKIFTN